MIFIRAVLRPMAHFWLKIERFGINEFEQHFVGERSTGTARHIDKPASNLEKLMLVTIVKSVHRKKRICSGLGQMQLHMIRISRVFKNEYNTPHVDDLTRGDAGLLLDTHQ